MRMRPYYLERYNVSKTVKQNETYHFAYILSCAKHPSEYLFDFKVCEVNNYGKSDNLMKYDFNLGNVLYISDRSSNNTDGNGKMSLLSALLLNLSFKQRNCFRTLSISFMVQ